MISEFIEVHQVEDENSAKRKKSMLKKIMRTEVYLKPLLDAMHLEGNRNVIPACDEACDLDEYDCSCALGSPWVESIQRYVTPEGIKINTIIDEFRTSWKANPLSKSLHRKLGLLSRHDILTFTSLDTSPEGLGFPKVRARKHGVDLETSSDNVYEAPDSFFDGGFFSNTALEIRAKLNSPQAILDAFGGSAPSEPKLNTCSKVNEMTIQYALEHAPDIVRKRYLERGIKLRAGKDIHQSNGPSWIWSHLDFSKEGECGAGEDGLCSIVDSPAMLTEVDHPVPIVGGKLYCKLLSPARVLDYMYTDGLRKK